MRYELNYDESKFDSLVIAPEEWEDQDLLHSYAFVLKLKNPAITFADIVKSGQLDTMNDEEYETALQNVKTLSKLWGGEQYANVFHLLAEATSLILRTGAAFAVLFLGLMFVPITGYCADESWHTYGCEQDITTDTIITFDGDALYNFNDTVAVGSGLREKDNVVPVEADYGFIAQVRDDDTVMITTYDHSDTDIVPVSITVERPSGKRTSDIGECKKCTITGYGNYPDGCGYITVDFSAGKELSVAVLKADDDLYVCNVEDHPLKAECVVSFRQQIQDRMDGAGITIQNATKTSPIYYPIVPQKGEADDVDYWLAKADNITRDSWTDAHKVVAFYNYILDNIAYDKYVVGKGLHSRWYMNKSYDGSWYTSNTKVGVCEDVSQILCIMCRNEGIPAVVVGADGHAWAEVYIVDYNRWISVDATKDMTYFAFKEDTTKWTYQENKKYSHVDDTNPMSDFDFMGIGNYVDMKMYGITG